MVVARALIRLTQRAPRSWALLGALVAVGALSMLVLARFGPLSAAGRETNGLTPSVLRSEASGTGTGDWSAISIMPIVDPRDYGAVGDGAANDREALIAAIEALGEGGGVVLIDEGLWFRVDDVVEVSSDHVKLWSPTGDGGIIQHVGSASSRQAIWCRDADGCGFFGIQLRSDAERRLDSLLDNQITLDGATNSEIVGVEISGSAATGVFSFGGSEGTKIQGSYVHHTWADGIHFTDGSRRAYVWDNTYFNDAPSKGDDGIACVTYGEAPLCGEMEWWNNVHLGGGAGRGFAVVGGEDINIHDNFVRESAAAGILVASERSYNTSTSRNITIARNVVLETAHSVGHPGILISGLNGGVDAIRGVQLTDNIVVGTRTGRAFASEGNVEDLINTGLISDPDQLPSDLPQIDGNVTLADTSVLRTWDTSFVPDDTRHGLYRIHIRRSDSGSFEQRFEYVIQADPTALEEWLVGDLDQVGHPVTVSFKGAWTIADNQSNNEAVVLLSSRPLVVPLSIDAVSFADLRRADLDGTGTALWRTLN